MKRNPKALGSRLAFSLFEIVVAITILGMIAGSVLSILWQAGGTANEIRELDQRDEEISIFLRLLKETIEGMPSGGSMTMVPPSESGSGFYELQITDAVTAFAFGEKLASEGETIIGMRPMAADSSGIGEMLFELALSREDFGQNDEDGDGMVFNAGEDEFMDVDEEGRYWLPLLSGVESAVWRFWDEDQNDWLDEWTNEDQMPLLLEFSIDDQYRPTPLRIVFEVPDHLVNPDNQQAQSQPATSNTTSTTTAVNRQPQRPGGGDGRGPGDGRGGDGRGQKGGRGGRGDGKGPPGGGGGPRPGGGPGGGGGRPPGGGGGAAPGQ